MQKRQKRVPLISIFGLCLSLSGCQDSPKTYPVDFVDRNAVFLSDEKPNPLMLVVEITEDGKLSLNKIETGTIDDTAVLAEKLKSVFDDREKTSISEREVVIDRKGSVERKDLEKVIENLAGVKASPIRVIKK